MNYKQKYLKYKSKYLNLKKISGGMDHDKSNHTETCQICSIELNNESNKCANPKAFKKVMSDGKVVCLACCDALDFMEDSKPTVHKEKPKKEKKLVQIKSNIKCPNCGNTYSTTIQQCSVCGTINPLFRKSNKKKKKKKKKK